MNQPENAPPAHQPRFLFVPATMLDHEKAAVAHALALEEAKRRSEEFLNAFQEKFPASHPHEIPG